MCIRRLGLFVIVSAIMLTGSLAMTLAQEPVCEKPSAAFAQGQAAYARGDFYGAVVAYSCALQGRPDNAAILNERGNAYRQLGNYAEAITDYNQAIELDAKNASFFNNRGYVEYQQGAMTAALKDFNQAIALNPQLAYAYNNRGLVYAKQGQVNLAAADFNKAIELNHDPISWPTKNLASLGLSAQTTATPELLPTLAPDDVAVGQAAYKAEDYDTAIAAFSRALNASPNSVFLLCERAGAYYMKGNYQKAIDDYTQAIDLGHMAMHYVWRGNSYAHLGQYDKAFADYQSAIDHDPGYLNAYLYSASLHSQQSEFVQSISDFKHWLAGMGQRIVTVNAPANGQTLKLEFTAKQEVYAISFSVKGNDTINAETSSLNGGDLDPVLILSMENVPEAVDDDSGAAFNAKISDFTAFTPCNYTLYVLNQGAVGSIELTLSVAHHAN